MSARHRIALTGAGDIVAPNDPARAPRRHWGKPVRFAAHGRSAGSEMQTPQRRRTAGAQIADYRSGQNVSNMYTGGRQPPRTLSEPRSYAIAAHLIELGPRPLAALLRELAQGRDPVSRIEKYASINLDHVRILGLDRIPPWHVIDGGGADGEG